MAARYLLDTNICIYAVSGRRPEVVRALDRKLPGQVVVSVIALGELLAGAAKSRHAPAARQRIEALTTVVPVVHLPVQAADHYGEIRSTPHRRKRSLDRRARKIRGADSGDQ